MANEESGVLSVDEGVGAEGTVQAVLPQSCVEYGNGNPDRALQQPSTTAGESTAEPEATSAPQLTAEELAKLPPELRPGPDGRPPKLTPKLLKQMRGHYFTVRHDTLANCGHQLDRINQPKNNCENCWYQFFNTHPQLVEVSDQFFRTHGKGPMVGMRGEKYFKNFVRYMATVIHFMKEEADLAAAKAAQEQANVVSREVVDHVSSSTVGITSPETEVAVHCFTPQPIEG